MWCHKPVCYTQSNGGRQSVFGSDRYTLDGSEFETWWGQEIFSFPQYPGSLPRVQNGVDHSPHFSAKFERDRELQQYSPSVPSWSVRGNILPLHNNTTQYYTLLHAILSIRGLSGNFPNYLNKSFSHFRVIGLCPLRSTPLHFLYIALCVSSNLEVFLKCLLWNTA